MAECNHDCDHCSEECGERQSQSFKVEPHPNSHIKKIYGVVSGKGGVGKSLVTSLLAVAESRKNRKVGILDADITGPSIPQCFGVKERLMGEEKTIYPAVTRTGIELVSMNLLMDCESDPVIWRGPLIAGLVKQFYTDVDYGMLDALYIDMPPGTGDVPLTVFQSIPMDGIIIVLTPQDLVSMIVEKAIKMAKTMNIPIIGFVENMSYVKCPDCGKEIKLFGEGHVDELSKEYNIPVIGRLPIDPEIAKLCDEGNIEYIKDTYISLKD